MRLPRFLRRSDYDWFVVVSPWHGKEISLYGPYDDWKQANDAAERLRLGGIPTTVTVTYCQGKAPIVTE